MILPMTARNLDFADLNCVCHCRLGDWLESPDHCTDRLDALGSGEDAALDWCNLWRNCLCDCMDLV